MITLTGVEGNTNWMGVGTWPEWNDLFGESGIVGGNSYYYYDTCSCKNGLCSFQWKGERLLEIGLPGKKKEEIELEIKAGSLCIKDGKETFFVFTIPKGTKEIIAGMEEGLLRINFTPETPPTITFHK